MVSFDIEQIIIDLVSDPDFAKLFDEVTDDLYLKWLIDNNLLKQAKKPLLEYSEYLEVIICALELQRRKDVSS